MQLNVISDVNKFVILEYTCTSRDKIRVIVLFYNTFGLRFGFVNLKHSLLRNLDTADSQMREEPSKSRKRLKILCENERKWY